VSYFFLSLDTRLYTKPRLSPIIKGMNAIRTIAALCLLAVFLAAPRGALAQEEDGEGAGNGLPRQFRGMFLGMGLDALQDALREDAMFHFRGERDVSLIPFREESLVETTGSSFVRRAFFQLRDGALFIMSFTMDTGLMDHHSMFTRLVERHGPPTSINPREAVWEDGATRISLERPLTVRYIDRQVFDDIVGESMLLQSRRVHEFQEFLDEF